MRERERERERESESESESESERERERERERGIVSSIFEGPKTSFILHSVYLHYANKELNDDIILDLTRRICETEHAQHIIGGDFQNPVTQLELGSYIEQRGWLSHAAMMNGQPTNNPPSGSPRVLDDLLLSPSLRPHATEFAIEEVAGFSTHSMVSCELLDEVEDVVDEQRLRPFSAQQVEHLLSNLEPDADRHWEGLLAPETQNPQVLYDRWLRALHHWLGVPEGSFSLTFSLQTRKCKQKPYFCFLKQAKTKFNFKRFWRTLSASRSDHH